MKMLRLDIVDNTVYWYEGPGFLKAGDLKLLPTKFVLRLLLDLQQNKHWNDPVFYFVWKGW